LGSDRISNDDNPLLQPGEGNEHGTHVLGIIAATQNNGIGIDGVNDKAPIWVGRAVGSGQWAESLVDFVNAARDSNQPNAVVNLSMDLTQVNPDGSVTTRYELTPQERAAIEYARQYNVLIVAAAGNDGDVMSVLGQASQEFDNIITVGSAQDFDPSIAPAEGFNRTGYSSYGYGLDIMAKGGTTEQPVLSTVGDGVGTMAGTSVATAEVTGAVSQVWAANPQLSYRQVIEIIKSTATDLDTPNWDAITGAGLLNLVAAVLLAKVTTPDEYDAPATVIPDTWSGEGKVTPSERAAAVPMWPTVEPTSFTGRVMATAGANVRSGPGTSFSRVGSRAYNSSITFDGWTYGERITDIALGTPDERWYRIAGTNQWIASAIIDGNAPGSTPLPPGNSDGGGTPLPPSQPNVPIDGNSPNYRNGNVNPFARIPALIGQCTWYAYGRMLETGLLPAGAKANGWFLGNAEAWRRDAARAGLPVSSTPTPGARGLVVWPPGVKGGHRQYGHVAFVEEVYPDGRIRISESNWAGKRISERILTPAQYSGLSFVRLENATSNPRYSSPPAQPGKQREYRVRLGDTLSGIAYRELGDRNRWREIKKADGSTFTEAEARNLQVGMSVYLPVSYQTGSGTPVTPPPSSTPKPIISGYLRDLYPVPYKIEQDFLRIGPERLGVSLRFFQPSGTFVLNFDTLAFKAKVTVEQPAKVQLALENFRFRETSRRQGLLDRAYSVIDKGAFKVQIEKGKVLFVYSLSDPAGLTELELDPITGKFALKREVKPSFIGTLDGLTMQGTPYYEVTGSYRFYPNPILKPEPVPVPAPKPAMERIKDFVLQIAQSGADAAQAANRFLTENPELVAVVAVATVSVLLALLFSGLGGWTVGLTLIPRLASVLSVLITVAQARA
jgi:surface antigen